MGETTYHRRAVDAQLDALLTQRAAVAIVGAPAVGKSTTALRRASSVFALEQPGVARTARQNWHVVATSDPPVLLDHWQRLPTCWADVERTLGARDRGRFLLTGCGPVPHAENGDRLGRLTQLRMRPLSLAERGVAHPTVGLAELLSGTRPALRGRSAVESVHYVEEIVASGFPGIRPLPGPARRAELDRYLNRVVDHHLPELGRPIRETSGLRRWLRAYAAATATTVPLEVIGDAAAPDRSERLPEAIGTLYHDLLERLFVIDPLPAWSPRWTHPGRLGGAPKHHLADPTLVARLLGLDAAGIEGRLGDRLRPGPPTLADSLFESLVALSVRVYAEASGARVGHLRTYRSDHELDLIVERADGRIVALDVRFTGSVDDRDVGHLRWLRRRLGGDLLDGVVLTAGARCYRRGDGIGVVPAALLGP